MLVSLIAAMDPHGLIGDGTGMPWHLPKDLRRFREFTWGKPIVMGRRTFESIGKPLPGRLNIVITSNPEFSAPGCRVAQTLREALSIAEEHLASANGNEVMVIGGGKVYAEAIQRWDRCYLTVVDGEFKGNTYFPIRELLRQNWRPAREPETHPSDEKNRYPHSFYVIERARDAQPGSLELDEDKLPIAEAEHEKALENVELAAILTRGTIGA